MPELPEVETVRRGLSPLVVGKRAAGVAVRHAGLRWPVDEALGGKVRGKRLHEIVRRAKYLLFDFGDGYLAVHLGMSGSLRYLSTPSSPQKHDHLDLLFEDESLVRLRDPRRFGAVLWVDKDLSLHPAFSHLGVEPLSEEFSGLLLYSATRKRKSSVKELLMDNRVLVGVGNIYANEALFLAGVSPRAQASSLELASCERLADEVKNILLAAIAAGGSTLRDFVDSLGKPGYFQQNYWVYGRDGLPCRRCGATIQKFRQAGRSSFLCPHCQV